MCFLKMLKFLYNMKNKYLNVNKDLDWKIKMKGFFPLKVWAKNMGVHYKWEHIIHGKIQYLSRWVAVLPNISPPHNMGDNQPWAFNGLNNKGLFLTCAPCGWGLWCMLSLLQEAGSRPRIICRWTPMVWVTDITHSPASLPLAKAFVTWPYLTPGKERETDSLFRRREAECWEQL